MRAMQVRGTALPLHPTAPLTASKLFTYMQYKIDMLASIAYTNDRAKGCRFHVVSAANPPVEPIHSKNS
jgi:hypothetical protein